jgi:hypothetical protein
MSCAPPLDAARKIQCRRDKKFQSRVDFFDTMDLGVEKNEGGFAEKIPSNYQTKKYFNP